MYRSRRWALAAFCVLAYTFYQLNSLIYVPSFSSITTWTFIPKNRIDWNKTPQRYPVDASTPIPSGNPMSLPQIQGRFEPETEQERETRLKRRAAIQDAFEHAWNGYKKFAWGEDEVIPVGGGYRMIWGGWSATLVDSLDTLWIMGLKSEFRAAVRHVAQIDFTTTSYDSISVFETTIRFLGGLLSAYDLSGEKILLRKATDLGDMLYKAFDTPNRMPVSQWNWKMALEGKHLNAQQKTASAEIGSMSLEFTRLSQLTGNAKYYDAIQRITELLYQQQNKTELPGMWPKWFDALDANFYRGSDFTVAAQADSLYEYLAKEHLLLQGGRPEYLEMYESFIKTAKQHLFFRVSNPDHLNIQLPGSVRAQQDGFALETRVEHLGCFIGGLVGIGARLLDRDNDLDVARELTDGCIWAYRSMPSGIMPETFRAVRCRDTTCAWDAAQWGKEVIDARHGLGVASGIIARERLVPGIAWIDDRRYLLRPEAIESVFVLFRITGDRQLLEDGWRMFEAIEAATRTEIAHTEIGDVSVPIPPFNNKMESFWTAETLKYFYLLFSEPDLISLDEYVFNTEAHPFRYRSRGKLRSGKQSSLRS